MPEHNRRGLDDVDQADESQEEGGVRGALLEEKVDGVYEVALIFAVNEIFVVSAMHEIPWSTHPVRRSVQKDHQLAGERHEQVALLQLAAYCVPWGRFRLEAVLLRQDLSPRSRAARPCGISLLPPPYSEKTACRKCHIPGPVD